MSDEDRPVESEAVRAARGGVKGSVSGSIDRDARRITEVVKHLRADRALRHERCLLPGGREEDVRISPEGGCRHHRHRPFALLCAPALRASQVVRCRQTDAHLPDGADVLNFLCLRSTREPYGYGHSCDGDGAKSPKSTAIQVQEMSTSARCSPRGDLHVNGAHRALRFPRG